MQFLLHTILLLPLSNKTRVKYRTLQPVGCKSLVTKRLLQNTTCYNKLSVLCSYQPISRLYI